MWIVRLALRRPYTFVVLALLLLILGPIVILRTATDIFPNINIPLVITYSASTVPILQLALSGQKLSEQQLFDLGVNFLRTRLVTIPGVAIPWPYGGKQRQVEVDLDINALEARSLSPVDVVNAISAQNLMLPAGTSKIGEFKYNVHLNGSPQTVHELDD